MQFNLSVKTNTNDVKNGQAIVCYPKELNPSNGCRIIAARLAEVFFYRPIFLGESLIFKMLNSKTNGTLC